MHRLRNILAAVLIGAVGFTPALVVAPSVAYAGLEKEQKGAVISGIAANAAEASRTAIVNVKTSTNIGLSIALTHSAASALTIQLYKSADNGTTYARVPSISISAGTGTASDYTVSKTVSGDDTLWIDLNVENATHVKIIVGATGGGANDLLTVKACASSWS